MTDTSNTSESTAVAVQDSPELKALKIEGREAVARTMELARIRKQIEGMEWGSGYSLVKGADLSGSSQHAIAQLVKLTGCNIALHLYILGGRPYLNADYWRERVAGQRAFVRDEQRNLSLRHIDEVRALASQAASDGDNEDATRLRRKARALSEARSHYSPPAWATEVYETIIYRYRENAPLDEIKAGTVDGEPWIEEHRECNWAGNKPKGRKANGGEYDADPVGNAEPAKTARSRSYRRCAVGAFQATLAPIEAQLRKLEDAIEGEFEVISSDRRVEAASRPGERETQAVLSSGEPEARSAQGAQDLPTREPAGKAWNANDARKRLFATLRDAGIEESGRKAWQAENDLPSSTSEWGEAEYDRAISILTEPVVEAVNEAAGMLGIEDVSAFALERLGHAPDTLKDWKEVLRAMNAMADAPSQGSLV